MAKYSLSNVCPLTILSVQESQKHRAGGTVCSRLSTVASEFSADVVTTEPCPRRMMHTIAGNTPQNL